LSRRAYDFDRIDWPHSGVARSKLFRGPRKDLKWPNQIDDLGFGAGNEDDAARSQRDVTVVVKLAPHSLAFRRPQTTNFAVHHHILIGA